MINPNNHDNPIEANIEKYTLISLDFSFLSELGADLRVSWISFTVNINIIVFAVTMNNPGTKNPRKMGIPAAM